MATRHDDDEDLGRRGGGSKVPFGETRLGALLLILMEGFQGLASAVMTLPALFGGMLRRGGREEDEEASGGSSIKDKLLTLLMLFRPGGGEGGDSPITRLLMVARWLILGDEEALAEQGRNARLIRMGMGIGGALAVVALLATLIWGVGRLFSGSDAPSPPPMMEQASSLEVADGSAPPPVAEEATPGAESGPVATEPKKKTGMPEDQKGASHTMRSAIKKSRVEEKKAVEAGGETWEAQVVQGSELEAEKAQGWDPVQLLDLNGVSVGKDIRGAKRIFGLVTSRSVREITEVVMLIHFLGADGQDVAVNRFNPLVVSGGLFGDRAVALEPKQTRKFSMPVGHLPGAWDGKIRAEIVSASFGE